jgi:hypothetical protein
MQRRKDGRSKWKSETTAIVTLGSKISTQRRRRLHCQNCKLAHPPSIECDKGYERRPSRMNLRGGRAGGGESTQNLCEGKVNS